MRFEYVLISPYTFVSYLFLSLYFSLRMFSDPSRVAASRSRQICAAGRGAPCTRLESKARGRQRRESVTFTAMIISCQCGTESFSSLHSYTVKNEIRFDHSKQHTWVFLKARAAKGKIKACNEKIRKQWLCARANVSTSGLVFFKPRTMHKCDRHAAGTKRGTSHPSAQANAHKHIRAEECLATASTATEPTVTLEA